MIMDYNVQGAGLSTTSVSTSITTSNNTDKVLKLKKRGIIYLSSIPPLITVAKLRDIFTQYGEVGRVYLQMYKRETSGGGNNTNNTGNTNTHNNRRTRLKYTEGWVEFESKNIAIKVADILNNQRIGTRKKSKYYDTLWNIKYLPRFKWVHLSERLAYERAVYKQTLRAEIQQAKKEASYYQASLNNNNTTTNKKKKKT